MKAKRVIPGRPVNDDTTVADKVANLVALTLDRSPNFDAQAIRDELTLGRPALALLASGGHLRRGELVLVAPGLRLRIDVPVGEEAIAAEENSDVPRGSGAATTWTLHVPRPDGLASMVLHMERSCPHVSGDLAPDEAPEIERQNVAQTIDLSRLSVGGDQR
jgi:hypothetical protein